MLPPLSEKHTDELDGLRGMAVVMVLVWHFVGSLVRREHGVWADLLHAMTIFGRSGVDLFFVLSGFLIIGILVDRRGSPNLLRTFYARRFFRIHPPYFALIALYWLCFVLFGPSRSFNTTPDFWTQFIAQVTFNFNALMSYYDGPVARAFSVTWSVAIEEWFYLIFPVIILMTPERRLPHMLFTVAVLSAGARAGVHLAYPGISQAPYTLMPLRLDGLCIGGLLALLYRHRELMAAVHERRSYLLRVTAALVLPIPFMIGALRSELWPNMLLWGHFYLSIAYAALLLSVLVFAGDRKLSFLRGAFLAKAGLYSYSLYLFHPLFLNLCFEVLGRRPGYYRWSDIPIAGFALAVTIAFCIALHLLIEGPARAYGRRFKYGESSVSRSTETQPSPAA